MFRLFIAASVLAFLTLVAAAQEDRRVAVTVTSVAGRSVFLDKGSEHGLVPGLRVRLFPVGRPSMQGVIRDVSTNSSRAEMPIGVTGLLVGTTGEVDVPISEDDDAQEQQADDIPAANDVPEHPPWTRQEEERAPDQPLLAPAYSLKPSEREVRVDGRIYSQFFYSRDQGEGRDSEFVTGRFGVWTTVTNLFGKGGRILFSGQSDYRSADLRDDEDDSDNDLLLDRFSYAVGGEEYAPYRLEFGRFYSIYVPELGLVDGVEGVLQFENNLKIGAAIGAYPRPFPDRDFGDDIGFHVFANYVSTESHRLNTTVGYQKTWHRGDADRDLLFGKINIRPTKKLWLYGSWKVDFYTGDDTIKGSGADLTEAWLQMRYSTDSNSGITASYSRYTWPELKRREFDILPPDLVQDGEVNRFDVSAWRRLNKNVRLSGRVNYWDDQDDDGLGGEVRLNWSNAFKFLSSLETTIYYTEGSFTEGIGYRIRAHKFFDQVDAYIGYELFDYETRGLGAGEESFDRQSVRGGVNWHVNQWSFSFNGDYYFGDREDAYSLGTYIQYNF